MEMLQKIVIFVLWTKIIMDLRIMKGHNQLQENQSKGSYYLWRHDDVILIVKWRQNDIESIAREERLKQSWLLRNGSQLQNLKLGLAVRYSYFMTHINWLMTKFSCPNRQIDCQNKTWNEKSSLEHVYLRYIMVKWFIWRFSWSSSLSYRA